MLQEVRLGTLEVGEPSTVISTKLPEFGLFDMPYLEDRGADGLHIPVSETAACAVGHHFR